MTPTQGKLVMDELVRRFRIDAFGRQMILGDGVGSITRAVGVRNRCARTLLGQIRKVRRAFLVLGNGQGGRGGNWHVTYTGVLEKTICVDVLQRGEQG